MIHCRILDTCFICFFIAACDTQEPATPVDKKIEVKKVHEKTTTQKKRPALNLSIDNLPIEHQNNEDNSLMNDKQAIEKHSTLFKTLSKNHSESDINLSGKVLTDKSKLDNKEYLDSVDGIQINIEGGFD